MQFIPNGPDVPTVLLHAHEEGRVVFFCGAGISYPADLPGFKRLVDLIYSEVGTNPDASEQAAYKSCRYDVTLDLLERRIAGHGKTVRGALHKVLQPNLNSTDASRTHGALLKLAKSREGITRLVTTNFDRIFEHVAKSQPVASFQAPMLPIPKVSRWNGLVYLHGLLPERPEPLELNKLVLTSGDFGLAYLTERWAARFVTDLFRNYVICFVGYSIDDPVLRYLMDALAADRSWGESTPLTYAFGAYSGDPTDSKASWDAKGVVPILYPVPADTGSHAALHETVARWAATYEDGTLGKERIVLDHAGARPVATVEDDFVSRMLWALTDYSGIPAKRFAEFEPAPSLEWLHVLSDPRYRHHDLIRFGVSPHAKVDAKLCFSTLQRPAAYAGAPPMSIVSSGPEPTEWDKVMVQMGRWLVRHLNHPALVLWLTQRGGQLHERFAGLVEDALKTHGSLALQRNPDALTQFRAQSPNAIPRPWLKVVWGFFLTGRIKSTRHDFSLYRWHEQFRASGLTPALRMSLRFALAPKITFSRTHRVPEDDTDEVLGALAEPLNWEIVLAADYPESSLDLATKSEHWERALPELLSEFQQLLVDALDLMRALGGADDHDDRSYVERPSISDHAQNRETHGWALLIQLLRDAWTAVAKADPGRSAQLARSWFAIEYPTFKRLALFAASAGRLPANQWLQWLEREQGWWLWSIATRRESLRLLVLRGGSLSARDQDRLEAAVLAGPPRSMFRDGIEPEVWQGIVDRDVWLRLVKLNGVVRGLGPSAATRLDALSRANPDWTLADNERDEFPFWMSGSGDPDFESLRPLERAPRSRRGLAGWLVQARPDGFPPTRDNWAEECRARTSRCVLALCDAAQDGHWPVERWHTALNVWSGDTLAARSWKYTSSLIYAMPDPVWIALVVSISRWLKSVSNDGAQEGELFFNMCRRVLGSRVPDLGSQEAPITAAINHPVGHVTEALINLWFKTSPRDGALLAEPFEPFFTDLCRTEVPTFRHARVILATHAIALYRVDAGWSVSHLLPLFDWNNRVEARATWEGFLWAPRLYGPILLALQSQFLETARHCSELGRPARQQFVAMLVYAGLNGIDGFTREQFRVAVESLPQEGLNHAAKVLVQALDAAGEKAENYWTNRVKPFWQTLWPKSDMLRSSSIAESAARLSIAANNSFGEALEVMTPWLQRLEHPEYVVHALFKSHLPERRPSESLRLLIAVISDQAWCPPDLDACLEQISRAQPALLRNSEYVRLTEFCKRAGG